MANPLLRAGDRAPAFTLPADDGARARLTEYRGRWVVLYFYPRNGTPGCTRQARSFQEYQAEFEDLGARVLAASPDDRGGHAAFSEAEELTFPLLIDRDAKVAAKYGVWREKRQGGRRLPWPRALHLPGRSLRSVGSGLGQRAGAGPCRAGAAGFARGGRRVREAPSVRELLQRLGGALGRKPVDNLSAEEMEAVFSSLLDGAGTDAQISLLFALMRAKGPTSDELLGCARAARARVHFPALPPETVVVSSSRVGKKRHPPTFLASAAAASACGLTVLLHATPGIPGGGITLHDLWQRSVGPPSTDAASAATALATYGLAPVVSGVSRRGLGALAAPGGRDRQALAARRGPEADAPRPGASPDRRQPRPRSLGMAADAIAGLGHEEALIVQGVEGSVDPFIATSSRGMRLLAGMTVPLRLQPEDFALFHASEPLAEHEDPVEAAALASCRALLGAEGSETRHRRPPGPLCCCRCTTATSRWRTASAWPWRRWSPARPRRGRGKWAGSPK